MDLELEKGYYLHSKKLGEGGFGVVKLATHLLTKEKVAVKIIDKETNKKDLFRVENEITALQVLRHKNIAKLFQVIETKDKIYLIMEYCSGGELFDYLVSRSRLTETESRKIIRSLVMVLAFIHAKGFAHRDIKPENILLDNEHNIKLIDFGLCAMSSMNPNGNLDGLSTCCGSPAYVAPELLLGDKYSGPAADIWSTGVLLYALLSGRLPFNNPNLALLYKSIKEGRFEMPKFLSNSAADLISKMLCVYPEKRITLQGILEHRWMNSVSSIPTQLVWSKHRKLSEEVLKEEESLLDEKILLKCSTLFPELDLKTLRLNIENKPGYHRATYWIVKKKPEMFQDFDQLSLQCESSNRRRSRSFSDFNTPKLKKIAQNAKTPQVNHNNNVVYKTNVAANVQPTANTDIKPKVKCSKRNAIRTPLINKKTNAITTQSPRNPVNKQLFGDMVNSGQKNFKLIDCKKPISPILSLNSDEHNENLVDRKLKAHSLESQNQASKQTPTKDTMLITPKKSLFKWLMGSATPRKTPAPRRFNENDKNSLKNIIITEFRDPGLCIETIMQILKYKRVNCNHKNFVIRCVLSTNIIILSFEFEILIERHSGRVAIQHKRIQGTSWDYIKICDHVKNELEKTQVTKC